MRKVLRVFLAAGLSALLFGCATVYNQPMNVPLRGSVQDSLRIGFEDRALQDDAIVGLAFSGGGTRAAAFSFGVLQEMERIPLRGASVPMIDRLDFISGVSGGSVIAAYYGLKKREALLDFREKFLLRNAEEYLSTNVSLANFSRAFGGGVNDQTGLTRFLDQQLFQGATFAHLRASRRPRIWINASDIYNRTSFVFGETAFAAICSDLLAYPLSDAVAASAAVPFAFAPIVVQAYPGQCTDPLPRWVERARSNPNAPPILSSFAKAISRYREGQVPYIKLLDGGLVDNYGLAGFVIAREASQVPYGPLTPQQAVKLRRALFLVVDARAGVPADFVRTVEGPHGIELIKAAVDTSLEATVGASYSAFDATMGEWQASLIRWRCGLSAADRARYGARPNWNCRDLKFFIGRLAFDQLDAARAAQLAAVPTSFKLPQEQVDAVIAAGRDTLRQSTVMKAFVSGL
ncbi:MAG TPA: patatin-like phospholipase family protein [Xanthobacteraceae bacterium]|nr:patatin-like phospholipase family protein [Xanthobacteraceae bacterium]